MSEEERRLNQSKKPGGQRRERNVLGDLLGFSSDSFGDTPNFPPEPNPNVRIPENSNNNFSVSLVPKEEWVKTLTALCGDPLNLRSDPEEVGQRVQINDKHSLQLDIRPPLSLVYGDRLIEHPMRILMRLNSANGTFDDDRQEEINRFHLHKAFPRVISERMTTRQGNPWRLLSTTQDKSIIVSPKGTKIGIEFDHPNTKCLLDEITVGQVPRVIDDIEDFLTVSANFLSTAVAPDKKIPNRDIKISPPEVKENKQKAQVTDGGTSDIQSLLSPKFNPEKYRLEVKGFSLKDMVGNPDLRKQIEDLLLIFEHQEHFARYGSKIPKGAIFYGPPGTGKTLAAKIVASQLGIPFYNYKLSDIENMWVGETPKIVNGMYDNAKTPCVIFIDELDAIARDRQTGSHIGNEIVTMLLQKIDGIDSKPGVILLGATNDIDAIDPAIRRGGRLREIKVDLPDSQTRLETFSHYARKAVENARENGIELFADLDEISFHSFANMTSGLAQSDIETIVNDAVFEQAKRALKDPNDLVTSEDIELMIRSYLNQKRDKTSRGAVGFNH